MILLLLSISPVRLITIRNSAFFSEADYSQMENIQSSRLFSQEWKSQQIPPKVRSRTAQKTSTLLS